jgi:alanine dehydrogenase
MIIGVPKEIKTNENRIALVPGGAESLVQAGHTVFIEQGAGEGSGFPDSAYEAAGAKILATADEVWQKAEMIMKVKEPIAVEWPRMRKDQVIFTYFHFAASEELTRAVMDSGCIAIAYETVQLPTGELPLLTPMSEVAGRMSVQEGAKYLEKFFGGRGVLLGGVPGVMPGKVVVLGGGIVGSNAARMAAGLGARVVMTGRVAEPPALPGRRDAGQRHHDVLQPLQHPGADQGCGHRRGRRAAARREGAEPDPPRGPEAHAPGSVIVDVAVDQGGCVETIKATTHEDPIYVVDGVIHYAVANMPGAVSRTSTLALTNATFPYALTLANKGWVDACRDDRALALGVNVVGGKVTYPGVADAFGLDFTPVEQTL